MCCVRGMVGMWGVVFFCFSIPSLNTKIFAKILYKILGLWVIPSSPQGDPQFTLR